jgi:hypothetical protein
MSKSKQSWQNVAETVGNDMGTFYDEMYGPLFHSGINIGREIVAKLHEGNIKDCWATLLSANGSDNGITSGFLTAVGIDPNNDSMTDILLTGRQALAFYKADMEITRIEVQDELEAINGGSYANIPLEQAWSLPAILIEYIPLKTENIIPGTAPTPVAWVLP